MAVSFVFRASNYISTEYVYELLVIATESSIKEATRILSIPFFISVIVAPSFGLVIALVTKMARLKPWMILGSILYFCSDTIFYHYRGGCESKDGIIGARVLSGFGVGLLSGQRELSAQAAVSHYDMTTVTGLIYVCYRIGWAVCSAVVNNYMYIYYLPYLGDASIARQVSKSPYTLITKHPWGAYSAIKW